MLWLFITIFAYFLFAITSLIDKYLLAGPPNPKSYAFYVGALGILALVLVPFVGLSIPSGWQMLLSLAAGILFLLGLFALYEGLEHFEASRVVPAIGGFLPFFTFGLVLLFGKEAVFGYWEILAFVFLILGSILITFQKEKSITFKSLKISAAAAFLFALFFLLAKFVYLKQPFWSGFILMRIGGFLAALFFLFTPEVKKEIFLKKFTFKRKTARLFLFNQAVGAGGFILQNFGIYLVPLGFLAFLNALEGTKYIFLLIFASLISFKFPQILKEEISRKIIFQKIIAILFIAGGLVLLSF